MPEDRSKDRHSYRVSFVLSKQEWQEFGDLLAVKDDNRSEVLRQFVRAMLGRPGVKMPRRRDYER